MPQGAVKASAAGVTGLLGCFAARRLLLAGAALARPRPVEVSASALPSVLLVVPARDEAGVVDATLGALEQLDYPAESLTVALVSDGSRDGTVSHLESWAAGRPRTVLLDLPDRQGKTRALNAAIEATPPTELVAVCDADLRPRPDFLRRLAAAFAEEPVGAAAAYIAPTNPEWTVVARYAAVESWVHQLVTSAGKDRLDLNPQTNGASAYRSSALAGVGGFSASGPGEDVRTTVALTRAGWTTRFVRGAVAENTVADRARDYWSQHVRWSRNLATARRGGRAPRAGGPTFGRRLEIVFLSSGYVDRLAFLAAIVFATQGAIPVWVPAGYGVVTLLQVAIALRSARLEHPALPFVVATFTVYGLDVVATGAALALQLLGRPRTWRHPVRACV